MQTRHTLRRCRSELFAALTITALVPTGSALAQTSTGLAPLAPAPVALAQSNLPTKTPAATAALIAPRGFKPSGRGAAYDRTALFVSKGRFNQMEAWLGRDLPYFSYFTAVQSPKFMIDQTRQNILNSKVLQPMKGRIKLCVQVPLAFATPGGLKNAKTPAGVVAVRGYLQESANGKHDAAFRETAQLLVQAGFSDAIIRLGHEFSGNWYAFSAVQNPDAYAAAYRHIVDVFRSVSPDFTFDFNGSSQDFGLWAEKAYPGDAYVDIVGTDIYDRGANKKYFDPQKPGWIDPEKTWEEVFLPRLEKVKEFALAKGKQISIPEWGIQGVAAAQGEGVEGRVITVSGDDPVFLRKMAEWMNALPATGPGSLAYHSYFYTNMNNPNEGPFELVEFPQSAKAYLELFGNPEKSNGVLPKSTPVALAPPAPVSPPAPTAPKAVKP